MVLWISYQYKSKHHQKFTKYLQHFFYSCHIIIHVWLGTDAYPNTFLSLHTASCMYRQDYHTCFLIKVRVLCRKYPSPTVEWVFQSQAPPAMDYFVSHVPFKDCQPHNLLSGIFASKINFFHVVSGKQTFYA